MRPSRMACVFLITRSPPRATLFPYTTLFRSARVGDMWSVYVIHVLGDAGTLRFNELRKEVDGIDRKSTRLNSSHSQISYAVFCLKKKIPRPRTRPPRPRGRHGRSGAVTRLPR